MENADAELDIYDELLTQAEIQGNVNKVNGKSRGPPRGPVVPYSAPSSGPVSMALR